MFFCFLRPFGLSTEIAAAKLFSNVRRDTQTLSTPVENENLCGNCKIQNAGEVLEAFLQVIKF